MASKHPSKNSQSQALNEYNSQVVNKKNTQITIKRNIILDFSTVPARPSNYIEYFILSLK